MVSLNASWRDTTPYLLYILLVSSIGPLQFGYHLAELNAPQEVINCNRKSIKGITTISSSKLPQCIPMNPTIFGLVSSIFTLGGLVGALAAGPYSSKYGRRPTMLLTTIFFTIGPLFEALAPDVTIMVIGRILSGMGAGASVVVAPLYISETAPPNEKGVFGALTQIMINVGIFIAQLLGYFLSHDQMWRLILAIAGAIGLFHAANQLLVPESPKWSADKGRTRQAMNDLQRIRGPTADVTEEINAWGVKSVDEDEEEALLSDRPRNSVASANSEAHVGIIGIATDPNYRPALIAVVGVMVAQQLCGINSIVMYSVSLLSHLLESNAALLTVVVSVVNVVTTTAFAPLVDRLGRKTCLLMSICGMGICSGLLAISIIYSIRILSAVSTLLFVTSFAAGLGPVPFLLSSELVGTEAVGATQSWALAANWIATFVVAQFFPVVNNALGKGQVYFVFMALAAVFFVFVSWRVPETKGKKNPDEVWGRAERRLE
ncbi:MFS transporter, SP family, solute carrier family 2, member 2 [Xylona heveae TC161]|uniref:MFS transporter, SP family, solute carrier family 2, member 2 n=1 Tax=Xylona heveae (strain CBS 132557 / TC161) TaxID=1328760 RepID=A0A164ZWT3_XYLHT|nr:MFS transporter, SP family, solute carrier family 2, member 2 [Xylona heveae TC161]KZF19633.1 MFS transporter, SP family, solute carrier family 2, member 2 [Xylona heveae TC161]